MCGALSPSPGVVDSPHDDDDSEVTTGGLASLLGVTPSQGGIASPVGLNELVVDCLICRGGLGIIIREGA